MLTRGTGKGVRVLGGLGIKLDVFQEFFNTPGSIFWRIHYDSSCGNGKGYILRQFTKNLAIFDDHFQAQPAGSGNPNHQPFFCLDINPEGKSAEEICRRPV